MKRVLVVLTLGLGFFFIMGATPWESKVAYAQDPDPNAAMKIGWIEVQGQRRIEEATILAQVKTKPGDGFTPAAIRQDIQAIYDTGFFKDVQVDVVGLEGKLKLTFIVTEKASLKEIEIVGADEVTEEKVREKLDFKLNTIVDQNDINRNIANIRKYYEESGFWLVEVTAEEEEVTPELVKLKFIITEGPEVQITQISFKGNDTFTDDELKDEMETSEWQFIISWFTSSGYLKRDELNQDLERLLDFYYNQGYIEAQIGEPDITLSDDKTKLYLEIPVIEGIQYKVKSVELAGNRLFTTSQLMEKVTLKPGGVFSRSQLRENIEQITQTYAKQGYLLTEVYPTTRRHPETEDLDLLVHINEGKLTYSRWIEIKGNENTRDKVIRRELKFAEGDILTSTALRRSYQRLNNLGFFQEVNLKTKPTEEENQLDIELKVKERPTGQFSVGAGWSSVDQLVGNLGISQGNLFGRGQRLSLSGTFGRKTTTYNLGFTEPWLFDTPLTAGFDLYYRTRRRLEFKDYNINRRGGRFSFSYPLREYARLYWGYMYEQVDVSEVSEDAPLIIRMREGERNTSKVNLALGRDSRDNRLRPTRGSKHRLSFEWAGGPLGGDSYFTRIVGESGWHFPIWWKFVLSIRGIIGYETSYNGREVPVEELFALGGDNSVRGFESWSIGPSIDGEVIGGNKELIFNVELHFPLVDPLTGLIFFDTGGAFGEQESFRASGMREGAGIGVRFFTPVGPIRLDWGYKLDRQEDESKYEWHFAIGTYF